MKLLIADDEKIIRHGISHCFDWSKFGIRTVLEAKNGKEALELVREHSPDILLTDIRMPLMDGVALVKEIRRENTAMQVIYITGFSDLEYLQAAVKNAAVDYIMKPVDPAELEAAIQRAVQNCSNRTKTRKQFMELERQALQSRPLLIKQLLFSILHSNYPSKEAVGEKLALLQLPFHVESTFLISVLAVQRSKEIPPKYDDDLFSAGFENIASEILNQQTTGYVFSVGNLEFISVVSMPASESGVLRDLLKRVQEAVQRYLYAKTFIVMGPAVEGLFSIQESYSYAQAALKQQFRFMPDALISYEDCPPLANGSYGIQQQEISDIILQLRSGNLAQAQARATALISTAAVHMTSAGQLFGFCLLLSTRISVNESKEIITQEEIEFYLEYMENLQACRTTEGLQAEVNRFLSDSSARDFREALPRRSQIVTEIKDFIHKHLEENPTIKEIAAQVFLAPTYICSLFKEETGQTVNAFMIQEKMEKAKFLFCGGALRVYEVSKLLGYQDVKYFSRTFKLFSGLTPSAYIEKVNKCNEE